MLLDEPTVGVDPQSRERIYDMLAEITRAGVSLLLSTHHVRARESEALFEAGARPARRGGQPQRRVRSGA